MECSFCKKWHWQGILSCNHPEKNRAEFRELFQSLLKDAQAQSYNPNPLFKDQQVYNWKARTMSGIYDQVQNPIPRSNWEGASMRTLRKY